MPSNDTVAVLLTCFNRKVKTRSCLTNLYRSINHYGLGGIDIYLVDDGSSDGTSEMVKKEFPEVNLIMGSGSLYWNRGMIRAWQAAAAAHNYDYYIWLNDDTTIVENGIERMVALSKSKEDAAIICASACDPVTGERTYGGTEIDKSGNKWSYVNPTNELEKCSLINGNFVLIPKKVYQAVGFLDHAFPHAIGDFDYSLRAKKLGLASYITKEYLAVCENDNVTSKVFNPKIGVITRFKNLYSPMEKSNPIYFARYLFRHFGLIKALKYVISVHYSALFVRKK